MSLKKNHLLIIVAAVFVLSALTSIVPLPPGPIGPYLDNKFSPTSPGIEGSWELEEWDVIPQGLPSALKVLPFLNAEEEILILCKVGEIHRVQLDGSKAEKVLDIKDRTFKKGEGGSVGMALHPNFGNLAFPDDQYVLIFYRWKPNPDEWSELGFNRLSKFWWDDATRQFNPDSEEILFQQFDRATWHNGGGMFFKPDGFLYLSLGDEGFEEHIADSNQRLNGGLFGGVIRIDVDNDPSRSHPIRRQPVANAAPPENWGETYSQGYSIPNDNPWLDETGAQLEEFYCIGIRSPFAMTYDAQQDRMWLADVGFKSREEINIIERGMNYQWPFKEGDVESADFTVPADPIGELKEAYFFYDRSIGSCVIGGSVYRGLVFPELNEKYLFADFINNRVMALTNSNESEEPEFDVLLNNIWSQPVDLPEKPGITGVHPLPDGEILVTVTGEEFEEPTKLLKMRRKTKVPDPPAKLSELNIFKSLTTLEVESGIIPYTVNSPLWSDGAAKKRWIAIPNDGRYNSSGERITFDSNAPWKFPEGTVFIKHFELPKKVNDPTDNYRLETRFFIIGKHNKGYGLTYQWNDEGTDAILLGGGTSKTFQVEDEFGSFFTQEWNYPSRTQCLTCHNDNADYVLGVNTHQLNGSLDYDFLGESMNQIDFFKDIGVLSSNVHAGSHYRKSYAIDDSSVSLHSRIKSYMDANCASCHRDGGVPKISMDLRYNQPITLHNTINVEVESHASQEGSMIIQTGSHQDSEFWRRDASVEDGKMPPLGRTMVDQHYVDSLAKWIDNLDVTETDYHELLVFPNPTEGPVNVILGLDFEPPFHIKVRTVSGRFIYQQTSNESSFTMDLSIYPQGTYILTIESNGIVKSSKVTLI